MSPWELLVHIALRILVKVNDLSTSSRTGSVSLHMRLLFIDDRVAWEKPPIFLYTPESALRSISTADSACAALASALAAATAFWAAAASAVAAATSYRAAAASVVAAAFFAEVVEQWVVENRGYRLQYALGATNARPSIAGTPILQCGQASRCTTPPRARMSTPSLGP